MGWLPRRGQVAQLVERSPEKAGVGGSIPSLATFLNNLQSSPSAFSFHFIPELWRGSVRLVWNAGVVLKWLASRFRLFSRSREEVYRMLPPE
jgi:hypothetical protein